MSRYYFKSPLRTVAGFKSFPGSFKLAWHHLTQTRYREFEPFYVFPFLNYPDTHSAYPPAPIVLSSSSIPFMFPHPRFSLSKSIKAYFIELTVYISFLEIYFVSKSSVFVPRFKKAAKELSFVGLSPRWLVPEREMWGGKASTWARTLL